MEPLITCKHCGSKIQQLAKFCGMCGKPVESSHCSTERPHSEHPQGHVDQEKGEKEPDASDEEATNLLSGVVDLCESDPDSDLALLQEMAREDLNLSSYPLFRILKATAYMKKGFAPLKDRQYVKIDTADSEELLRYLNNADLNNLESALHEIAQIDNFFEDHLINPSSEDDKVFGCRAEGIATVLERCRPGRVQEILGKTKLRYFGTKRIKTLPAIEEKMPLGALKPFLDVFFCMPRIVRCALVSEYGQDAKGRKFIWCRLFEGLFDELGPDDTLKTLRGVKTISVFDDGTLLEGLAWEPKEGKEQRRGFFKKFFD